MKDNLGIILAKNQGSTSRLILNAMENTDLIH